LKLDVETLMAVGEMLHGHEWRRPLAADLGPLHPEGARDTIDPRLPARWATGKRAIPAWVRPALALLLIEHAQALAEDAERARALADRLKGE
jgi:hypothetical protein